MIPVGFDVGHSAVKLSVRVGDDAQMTMIPSVVMPAFHISDDQERIRANKEKVQIADASTQTFRDYFVGETAIIQGGETMTGLHDEWIGTTEYAALMLAGHRKLIEIGVPADEQMLMMGLPVANFPSARDELTPIVKGLLPKVQFKILMQPLYALMSEVLDENGNSTGGHNLADESWAVIDIGHFTTDIISIERGRYIEQRSCSTSGVSMACQRLISILSQNGLKNVSMVEAEQSLRTNQIKNYSQIEDITQHCNEARQALTGRIIEEATRLLSDTARRRTGVLLAGGGASIVYENLKTIWPNTHLATSGRFAVSEGMRRMGASLLQS